MPLPPWQLYSRTRVLYYIADEAALKRFGTEESIVADHLNLIVGLKPRAVGAARYLPVKACVRQRGNLQLLEKVRWIENVGTGELVPVGADIDYFVTYVASERSDMQFFTAERLAKFVNSKQSQLFNSGKRVEVYTC